MNDKFLELHLSQAQIALNKSINNDYADLSKEAYQNTLHDFFNKIKENLSATVPSTEPEVIEIKRELDFIFKSLEFLDSSTLNLIPFELVECLKYSMAEWLEASDKYIITTSLINEVLGFSFDNSIFRSSALFQSIFNKYGIKFDHKLVLINVPKVFARDYLISVVLYHELGHFIDHRYKISGSIAFEIFQRYLPGHPHPFSAQEQAMMNVFFPFLKQGLNQNTIQILSMHIAEYFCDLFAAQYVGLGVNNFLDYHTIEHKNDISSTHPATVNRTQVVTDFLNGNQTDFFKFLNNGIRAACSGKELQIRFENLSPDEFYKFLPIEITKASELHGIYKLGWDIWMGKWEPFQKNMNMTTGLSREQVYAVINNLIEKSIGNFIINNKWKQLQP